MPALARGQRAPRACRRATPARASPLHLDWERALFDARWAVVSWPEEYGGRDATPMEWLIFEEEYYRAGGPQRVTQNGIFLLAPTVFEFGTPEQQDRILPRMAAAEDLWCQGWSEPNAGQRPRRHPEPGACATTRPAAGGSPARRRGRPAARSAPTCSACSAPTPTAERHRGLTYFLVPLDAPGVTVRGFGRLDGDEGFAEVFLDDVFVPDADVLGEVDQGWSVAMATTSVGARLTLRSPGRFMATAARLVELWRERGARRRTRSCATPSSARCIDAEAYRWQTFLTVTRMTDGENARRGVEPDQGLLVGARRAPARDRARAARRRRRARRHRPGRRATSSRSSGPIYAGTNEIQRNVIAERVLGLPRR